LLVERHQGQGLLVGGCSGLLLLLLALRLLVLDLLALLRLLLLGGRLRRGHLARVLLVHGHAGLVARGDALVRTRRRGCGCCCSGRRLDRSRNAASVSLQCTKKFNISHQRNIFPYAYLIC
jgi:hypothetical protein